MPMRLSYASEMQSQMETGALLHGYKSYIVHGCMGAGRVAISCKVARLQGEKDQIKIRMTIMIKP